MDPFTVVKLDSLATSVDRRMYTSADIWRSQHIFSLDRTTVDATAPRRAVCTCLRGHRSRTLGTSLTRGIDEIVANVVEVGFVLAEVD